MAYVTADAGSKIINTASGTVASAIDIEGGYFPVTSLNDIPDHAKVLGALCYVTGTAEKPINKFYQYDGEDWVEKEFGTTTEATTSAAGLMSAADKTKLTGIASGAEVNVQADWNERDSSSDAYIKHKPDVIVEGDSRLTDARTPVAHNQAATTITEDSTHRFVTDSEKETWGAKQETITDLATIRSNASTGEAHSKASHARTDATKVEASNTNGNIKINDVETTVYTHPDKHAASIITGLSTVATSGKYTDLTGTPDIATTDNAGLMSKTDKEHHDQMWNTWADGSYFVTASTEITSTGEEGKIPDYACVEGALCYCIGTDGTEDYANKFYQYNDGAWTEKVFAASTNSLTTAEVDAVITAAFSTQSQD